MAFSQRLRTLAKSVVDILDALRLVLVAARRLVVAATLLVVATSALVLVLTR